jgi:ribosome-associated protein
MPRTQESARKGPSPATAQTKAVSAKARAAAAKAGTAEAEGEALVPEILKWLDEAKAENIIAIDIKGKTSIGDCMIVATGRSDRHVGAIADDLQRNLKEYGVSNVRVEGQQTCDWVLVDVGATIVHLFRPEVREFYNLEKMWSGERPEEQPN